MDIIISGNEQLIHLIRELKFNSIGQVSDDFLSSGINEATPETDMEKKQYKASCFNYIVEKETSVLIYNTLYNSLARFSIDEYQQFLFKQASGLEFKRELFENGFWVDRNTEEMKQYFICADIYTHRLSRPLNITITPTLKCNARCSYCYEKGIKQTDIYPGAEAHIVGFIKNHMLQNEVLITWFGGEPLMNPCFIDSLTEELRDENIPFSSYIITNGSLIDKNILEHKLDYWNVQDIQITLDGTEERYERIKNYKNAGESRFYNILNTIRMLSQKNLSVHIRLNIDRSNKEDILLLLSELDHIYAECNNITFYPAFISGTGNPFNDTEKVEIVRGMLQRLVNITKITAGTKFYSMPRMHACMNSDPRSFTFDVNGDIFTCEHCVGNDEYSIGNLQTGLLDEDPRCFPTPLRDECQACVFLPKCFGGCEANYMEGDSPCMIEKYIIQAYLELLC